MANLYELTESVRELQNICLNEDLDLTDEEFGQFMDASFKTFSDLQEKLTAYARLIKNLAADAEAMKAEKQIIHKRQSSIENKVERLKEALHGSMLMSGIEKVDGIPGIRLAKNPMSIDRDKTDLSKVDEEWLAPPVERALDSRKVLAHIKETGDVPEGIVVITDRTSVRIK